MIVETDFPCGNGRIYWINPGHFEVEAIAYSKAARYVCLRIRDVEAPMEQEVILRPDRFFHDDFKSFQGHIWVRRGEAGVWEALAEAAVLRTPEVIRFTLALRPGEPVMISTEPPRPYGETVRELFKIAGEQPELASVRSIGASMEERPLLVLRIAEAGRAPRPKVFIVGGEHASETAGEEILRGVLAGVLAEDAAGEALRERFDFEFLLNANPDGNYHGWHQYNLRDWREHNYADRADRSWHHEFGAYFAGQRSGLSAETLAIGAWVEEGRPAFLLNGHSWTGHRGNPGAFRTAPELLAEPLRRQMELLDTGADAVARSLGFRFEVFPSSNLCGGHLVDLLMEQGYGVGYAVEGHPNLGRERAQHFGARLIQRWLLEDGLLDLPEVASVGARA